MSRMLRKRRVVLGLVTLWSASSWAPSRDQLVTLRRQGMMQCRGKRTLIEEIEGLGGRVTATDVAGLCGSVSAGERQLLELAARLADGGVRVEAMEDGRLVFDFGKRPAKRLARLDSGERWLRRWRRAKPGLQTVGKMAFGTGLFVSMAVWSALLLALQQMAATEGASDERREPSSSASSYSTYYASRLWWDMMLWSSWSNEPRPIGKTEELNFLEAVYSYVFGDGDPNADLERASLEAAAQVVRENDGVVSAEQLAPYVLSPPENVSPQDGVVDESWVLPTVMSLGGRPELAGEDIVYVFEDPGVSNGSVPSSLEEQELKFSKASTSQLVAAGLLGAVNLVGAAALGSQLANPSLAASIGAKKIAALRSLCVPLLAYALTYNLVPAVRAIRIGAKNKQVRERNKKRRRWATLLNIANSEDDREQQPQRLGRKLATVRAAAANRLLRQSTSAQVAYSTSDDFQIEYTDAKTDDMLAAFDRRLESQPNLRQIIDNEDAGASCSQKQLPAELIVADNLRASQPPPSKQNAHSEPSSASPP